MNSTIDRMCLVEVLHKSDIEGIKKLYPSKVGIDDIRNKIKNIAFNLPKIGFSDEMIKYLCSIDSDNIIGLYIIGAMICSKISIDRISKVFEYDLNAPYIVDTIVNLYDSDDSTSYSKDVINTILDRYEYNLELGYLDKFLRLYSDIDYGTNDCVLYITTRIIRNEQIELPLSNSYFNIINTLTRFSIQNDLINIRDILLSYIPDSPLNSEQYRNNIPKLIKPISYISFFHEDI